MGDVYTVSRSRQVIEWAGTRVAHSSELDRIEVRTFHHSYEGHGSGGGPLRYGLIIVFKGWREVAPASSLDPDEIAALAEEIADLLGAELRLTS